VPSDFRRGTGAELCFKHFLVALQREPSLSVRKEVQEEKESFLNLFREHLSIEARLL